MTETPDTQWEDRAFYVKEIWRRQEAEKAAREVRGEPPPETIRIECPKCRCQGDWPVGKRMPSCAGCYLTFGDWPRMRPVNVTVSEPQPKKPTVVETLAELSAQMERLTAAVERLEGEKAGD